MSTSAIIALLCVLTSVPGEPAAGPPPASVYSKLDGTWSGEFVGYDVTGRELYRIDVRQTYETVDETTQRVTIVDRAADGSEVTGRGTNIARRRPDGTLELTCRVEKSNGEVVEHAGRLITGPDGDRQLVWWSRRPDRDETFRESVRREGDADIYEINGMGRYDGTLILMHGRYRRVTGTDG